MKGYIVFSRNSVFGSSPLPLSIHHKKKSATEALKRHVYTITKLSRVSFAEAKKQFYIAEVRRMPK